MARPPRSRNDVEPGNPRRQRAQDPEPDPDPEPNSPAPPIIILAESSDTQTAPHFQVPDPAGSAGAPHEPHPLTSYPSPAKQPPSLRYRFRQRKQEDNRELHNPDIPHPEPHPAPPVIILSNKRPASSSPTRSTTPDSTLPDSSGSLNSPPQDTFDSQRHKMGSKASRITRIEPAGGKLQASQERKDKEELKEPSNYYTHRSKSMRKKAGKTKGASIAADGGLGSTTP